ncbi:hypothetical protein TNCV_4759481 [Trichonephila clavipes]|nr:hypothetical protein TNCV_4759481 [Trichonephila clavipes]
MLQNSAFIRQQCHFERDQMNEKDFRKNIICDLCTLTDKEKEESEKKRMKEKNRKRERGRKGENGKEREKKKERRFPLFYE